MLKAVRGTAFLATFLAGLAVLAAQETPATAVRPASADLLPASTRAWFSIPDWSRLTEHFNATGFGLLAQDERMKPFADSLKGQIDEFLNERNFRLGITIDDIRNLRSGEICFAGVLPEPADGAGEVARGSHGIVLLVDIAGNEARAAELLEKVRTGLLGREATEEAIDPVQGVAVQKFRLKLKNPGAVRHSLHAISDGWLLASDNEQIFREVIRRLKNPDLAGNLGCLRDDESFKAVLAGAAVDGFEPDLRWFVEPFGYVQLAQAIKDEDAPVVQRHNDTAGKLRRRGFDVFRAVGGVVGFNQLEHDLVHRTYLHAPVDPVSSPERARCRELVNLQNKWGFDFLPEPLVPASANSYATLAWDMQAALANVEPIVDEFFDEGAFDRFVNGWKVDLGVDLNVLVGGFNNRISILTATARPVDETSERVAIVVPIKAGAKNTFDDVCKLVGPQGKLREKDGTRFLLVEKEATGDDVEIVIDDPRFLEEDPENFDAPDDEGIEAFNLFERRLVAVARGHLIVANNEEFLLELIAQSADPALAAADDWRAVQAALDSMSDSNRVCAREFGRIDQLLEVNYEMLRQDKMAKSQTSLARVLNRVFQSADDPEAERKQKIDGTTLPSDYAGIVAPFLGPSGWVMENTGDGWLLSGCILKKKVAGESEAVVRREPEVDQSKRR